MTDIELTGKVHSSMYHQCQKRGYAAPVDVLLEIGVLPKQKYEDWRHGRVDYLKRVCTVNLRKLSFIMHQIRVYAQKSNLKPSVTVYKQTTRCFIMTAPIITLKSNKITILCDNIKNR